MPELPEVEVTRRGLIPHLVGQKVVAAVCRVPRLRDSLATVEEHLEGLRLADISRRGKYLIWRFVRDDGGDEKTAGFLLTHLGMSGVWRVWKNPAPAPKKHDHVDIEFEGATARLTDPRRFSSIRWFDHDPRNYPPLNALGAEPFDENLTTKSFAQAMRSRRRSVKEVLMAGDVVVGCGNIYCSESLFLAGIDPRRSADRISEKRYALLLEKIRQVLASAISLGGSTLRDFHGASGEDGYFALQCAVYGRENEPCRVCGRPICRIVQGQRSTFYCPKCQK